MQPFNQEQSKLKFSASFACLGSVQEHGVYQSSFFRLSLAAAGVNQPISVQTDHSYPLLNSHISQRVVLSGFTFCPL